MEEILHYLPDTDFFATVSQADSVRYKWIELACDFFHQRQYVVNPMLP